MNSPDKSNEKLPISKSSLEEYLQKLPANEGDEPILSYSLPIYYLANLKYDPAQADRPVDTIKTTLEFLWDVETRKWEFQSEGFEITND